MDSQNDVAPLAGNDLDRALTLQLIGLQHTLAHRQIKNLFGHGTSTVANPLRGQGQVLALLKNYDELPTKTIADLLGIRTASLNELLGKLEAKGLITRNRSTDDGRVIVVSLTEEGRAVEQNSALDSMNALYEGLSEEEKRQLIDLLGRIKLAAKEPNGNDDRDSHPGYSACTDAESLKAIHREAFQRMMRAHGLGRQHSKKS